MDYSLNWQVQAMSCQVLLVSLPCCWHYMHFNCCLSAMLGWHWWRRGLVLSSQNYSLQVMASSALAGATRLWWGPVFCLVLRGYRIPPGIFFACVPSPVTAFLLLF